LLTSARDVWQGSSILSETQSLLPPTGAARFGKSWGGHALRAVVTTTVVMLLSLRAGRGDTVLVSHAHSIERYDSFTGADGGVFAGGMSSPEGLAIDSMGNVYVANYDSNTIEKFSPNGIDLGVFASTGLNQPVALAFDAVTGSLYVANAGAFTIERFSLGGVDLGVFASDPLASALACDTAGNLYVVSELYNRINRFTPTGSMSVFVSSGLKDPMGLAFDAGGNLFVLNRGDDTIRKFSSSGADLGVFASTGMSYPQCLAIDSAGNLYAGNFGNGTIERFTPDGTASVFAHLNG
jgi:large repetitive protein